MPLLILLLFLIPSVTFSQSGSSTDIGNTTFYNFDMVVTPQTPPPDDAGSCFHPDRRGDAVH
jgi:hypothetical protein